MLRLLTSPQFGTALGIFFVSWLAITFTRVYGPIYTHYRDGCVKTYINPNTTAVEYRGTYWSETLYSISYNYASRDGSQHALTELNEFNEQRTKVNSGREG